MEEKNQVRKEKKNQTNTKAHRRKRKDNVRQALGAQGQGSKKKCHIDTILVIN